MEERGPKTKRGALVGLAPPVTCPATLPNPDVKSRIVGTPRSIRGVPITKGGALPDLHRLVTCPVPTPGCEKPCGRTGSCRPDGIKDSPSFLVQILRPTPGMPGVGFSAAAFLKRGFCITAFCKIVFSRIRRAYHRPPRQCRRIPCPHSLVSRHSPAGWMPASG